MIFSLSNWYNGGGDEFLEPTKIAVKAFLNTATKLNIAIISTEEKLFSYPYNVLETVPVVLSHFKPIDSFRNELIAHIDSLTHIVPLFGNGGSGDDTLSLLTAWEYFGGREHYDNFIVVRDTTALNGNSFISPIKEGCNNNNIILFTRYVHTIRASLNNFINNTLAPNYTSPPTLSIYDSTKAFENIHWFLGMNDVNPNISGEQNVKVFSVYMPNSQEHPSFKEQYKKLAQEYTGGDLYPVANLQDITAALQSIEEAIQKDSILVSPIIRTDSFGFHTQDKKIYFALFKPAKASRWQGNLKCYKMGADGIIYDKNNNPAIDSDSGFFKTTAHSFWSSTADGNDITAGGMAEHISKDRKVYSDILDSSYNSYANNGTPLSDVGNKLHESNSNITPTMLNITTGSVWTINDVEEKNKLLKWARGVDVDDTNDNGDTTDSRKDLGAPLHTKPLLVKYYTGDETLYLTTNDGFLHAVNPENGNTIFSFIPRDLLPNLRSLKSNNSLDKIYGLDAPMTALTFDGNADGNILQSVRGSVSPNEAIMLILPMRRGGRNIYGLNVSDRDNPKVAWTIRGGKTSDQQTTQLSKTITTIVEQTENIGIAPGLGASGGLTTFISVTSNVNVGIGDFTKLGQTWSIAMPAMVKWQGSPKVVFFFGGGYDEQTDNQTIIQSNSMGNAIFMVDAISGERLWQASGDANNGTDLVISGMDYSMVSNLTFVDINQDGFPDFIIATDVGGQVFRIDINNNNTGPASFAIGSLIAKLSDNTLSGSRRFFEAATVSLISDKTQLNIAIGSGFRANPHSSYTQDRIYVIKDNNVFAKPTNYAYANGDLIRETNLYNATDNLIQSGTSAQKLVANTSLKNKHGWYMDLEQSGEKLLSKLQIYAGVLTFTTYTPPDSLALSSCQPNLGESNLYAINIDNASAVANLTGGSTLGKNDRKKKLKLHIAPEPSIINRGKDGIKVCVGTECFDNIIPPISKSLSKIYWREN